MAKKKVVTEQRTLIYPRGAFNPEDFLTFIQLGPFVRNWKDLDLTDDDLRHLEMLIMANPKAGDVIAGTGGLRKLRAVPSRWQTGKSGALRVCYAFFEEFFVVVLFTAYRKNRKDNISPDEKKIMKEWVAKIHSHFAKENVKRA